MEDSPTAMATTIIRTGGCHCGRRIPCSSVLTSVETTSGVLVSSKRGKSMVGVGGMLPIHVYAKAPSHLTKPLNQAVPGRDLGR